MDLTVHKKAERFRRLHHRKEILVLPNPWNAGTARLLEHLGFEALATTSAGLAHSIGVPDGAAGKRAALQHATDIAAATSLPVSADLENCYAEDPAGVAATVTAAMETGIVGCSVEDATGQQDGPIYDFDLAVARVEAAADAAVRAPYPFTLTARAENYLYDRPDLADTVRRLQAFAAAGADVVYAPGLADLDDIRAVVSSVPVPVNVLARPGMTVTTLQECGVARVSVGSGLSRAAFGAFFAGAVELIEQGTFGYGWQERPVIDLNGIFGSADRS